MKVIIEKSNPKGIIKAPPSKSIAHRLIILSSLSKGTSVIKNIALSNDVKATLSCIQAIGAKYLFNEDFLIVSGTNRIQISDTLDCGECGSTLRFFIPICLLSGEKCVLTGSRKLLSRPLEVYENICKKQNILFINDGKKITVKGKLSPGKYVVPGNISSQFISGLLMTLALLPDDSEIEITGNIESKPYIDITMSVQKLFGVSALWKDDRTLFIKGNQRYHACAAMTEGDWSNAAFLFAMGADVIGVNHSSLQGDRVCIDHFSALKQGCAEIDITDCPDLGPVLFAFAAAHHGAVFTGTSRLKLKESDRSEAMAKELRKFGVNAIISDNEVIIPDHELKTPSQALFGYNDHRIVMSLAYLCSLTGGVIEGAQAVNKSYPGFFEDIAKLGVKLRYEA